MIISRFFQGFFSYIISVNTQWFIHEFSLEKHKQTSVTLIGVCNLFSNIYVTLMGVLDNGSFYLWRISHLIPLILMMISALIQIFYLWEVDAIKYQIINLGKDITIRNLKRVYTEEKSGELLKEFQLILENENLKNEENPSIFSRLDSDLRIYKKQIINFLITKLGITMILSEVFNQFSVTYISKSLENFEEVNKSKKFLFFCTIAEGVTFLAVTFGNLIRQRKFSLTIAIIIYSFTYLFFSFGYYFKNLKIAKIGVFFKITINAFFSNVSLIYAVEILPQSFVFLYSLTSSIEGVLGGILVPLVFGFEGSSYEMIGIKFFGLFVLGNLGAILCNYVMIETFGKSQFEVIRCFGSEVGEVENLDSSKKID